MFPYKFDTQALNRVKIMPPSQINLEQTKANNSDPGNFYDLRG